MIIPVQMRQKMCAAVERGEPVAEVLSRTQRTGESPFGGAELLVRLVLAVRIYTTDDQQLEAPKALVLAGGHHRADNTTQSHWSRISRWEGGLPDWSEASE